MLVRVVLEVFDVLRNLLLVQKRLRASQLAVVECLVGRKANVPTGVPVAISDDDLLPFSRVPGHLA